MESDGQLTARRRSDGISHDYLPITAPLSAVRASLLRKPDYEDAYVVSWANVTRAEAMRLLDGEPDPAFRRELLAETDDFFAGVRDHFVSLHFCQPYAPAAEVLDGE